MLWSVLPFLENGGGTRLPRRAVATAVRLVLFAAGTCIAFAVSPASFNVTWLLFGYHTVRQTVIWDLSCWRLPLTEICVQAYAILGNVMSLVGGFASISCSLLMPSLFFLILFWKELGTLQRTGLLSNSLIHLHQKAVLSSHSCSTIYEALCFLRRCLNAIDCGNGSAGPHCGPEHN